ncbi:MAG: polymerase subunit gamma and tau, partial [Marmoricola sp.]|nr:polymerase subunit gamma and tau [Marmoricola sp.]
AGPGDDRGATPPVGGARDGARSGPTDAGPPPAWAQEPPPEEDREDGDPGPPPEAGHRGAVAAARSRISPTRQGEQPAAERGPDLDADAHRDDPTAEDNGLDGAALLARELGATVIEDVPHT